MNKIEKSERKETTVKDLPAPQGIGMAVAFDWGLAVQIALTPIVYTVFGQPNQMKMPGLNPALGSVLFFIIAWLVAIGLIFFGEMVRRAAIGRSGYRLLPTRCSHWSASFQSSTCLRTSAWETSGRS